MNTSANTNRILTAIAALIVIGGLFFFYSTAGDGTSNSATSTYQVGSSTDTTTNNGVTGTGEFTVSPEVTELNIPDFRAAIRFQSGISPEVRTAVQNAADTLAGRIAKDSFDLEAWINLGIVRKAGGDYKGAETAWIFVTTAAPNDPIAYNDLGDLYTNFLKDYPKAETNYLKVISVQKTNVSAYIALSMLYTNFYKKDTGADEAILKKGIGANPDSIDLLATLARYYKARNRMSEAKTQYDAAIAVATKQNHPDVAAQLKAEAGE